MASRRRTLALAAAGALLTTGLVTGPAAAGGLPAGYGHGGGYGNGHGGGPGGGHGGGHGGGGHGRPSLVDRVTTEAVVDHLEAFQAIADEHGNRAAMTPGYEASAQYVERTLRAAGYTTTRDPFTFEEDVVDAATFTTDAGDFEVDQMEFSPSGPEAGVSGAVVAPTDSFGCTAASYDGTAVAGAIALASRGGCPFSEKAVAADTAGAAALVVYNNTDGMLFGTLGTEGLVDIPVAGMSLADGQVLAGALAGGVSATLDVRSHAEQRESFNVIAETRKGRDDNVVMLGAHLDGVEEGPGINDNATGSAAILEVAVQLAKGYKHDNTVRFAWWGAEELGLQGSAAYVEELAGQEGELDRIATYLNFDMVGSPNYIIGVYDADESTYPAPVEVPEGSAATEDVLTEYFDGIGQPWVDTEFSGRSDYEAFILNGIPASGLFTGADDVKTEEEVALFGGTAGITHDPNYHSAADDISNVNVEALGIMTDAIAAATWSLAQDTSAINGVSGPGPRPGHGHGHGGGHGGGHWGGHGGGHGGGHWGGPGRGHGHWGDERAA